MEELDWSKESTDLNLERHWNKLEQRLRAKPPCLTLQMLIWMNEQRFPRARSKILQLQKANQPHMNAYDLEWSSCKCNLQVHQYFCL